MSYSWYVLWYTVHSVVYTCDLILARIWLLGLCPFINRVLHSPTLVRLDRFFAQRTGNRCFLIVSYKVVLLMAQTTAHFSLGWMMFNQGRLHSILKPFGPSWRVFRRLWQLLGGIWTSISLSFWHPGKKIQSNREMFAKLESKESQACQLTISSSQGSSPSAGNSARLTRSLQTWTLGEKQTQTTLFGTFIPAATIARSRSRISWLSEGDANTVSCSPPKKEKLY